MGGKGHLFSTEKEIGNFRSPSTNPFKHIEQQKRVMESELYQSVKGQGNLGRAQLIHEKKLAVTGSVPFFGKSLYQEGFVNWRGVNKCIMKHP